MERPSRKRNLFDDDSDDQDEYIPGDEPAEQILPNQQPVLPEVKPTEKLEED